ncbi:MAG: hypothetical protein Q4G13_08240, partial [Moraxella sp.]|nr:hypothetical protein [Moraxella sp.]
PQTSNLIVWRDELSADPTYNHSTLIRSLMNAYTRFTPFFVAAALPMVAFVWFLPTGAVQLDLWLLWFVAMVLVGLPVLLGELALAHRSKLGVWQGMQLLTREADVGVHWRSFAGLSVVVVLLLAAFLIAKFATWLAVGAANDESFAVNIDVSPMVLSGVLMIVAMILSLLKQKLVGLGAILVVLSGLLALVMGGVALPVMTNTTLGEWAIAVAMALFSVGSGTGLYWFMSSNAALQQDTKQENTKQQDTKTALSRVALPIWSVQVVFGALAFLVAQAQRPMMVMVIGGLGVVMFAAYLLYYAFSQMMARVGMIKGAAITVVLALALAVLPSTILQALLIYIGLAAGLVLAVFMGWLMKISHLRKTLNFNTELRYNLWRMAVRIVVPIAILLAFVGSFMV